MRSFFLWLAEVVVYEAYLQGGEVFVGGLVAALGEGVAQGTAASDHAPEAGGGGLFAGGVGEVAEGEFVFSYAVCHSYS